MGVLMKERKCIQVLRKRVDVHEFKKIMIVYNANAGKHQFFGAMKQRVAEVMNTLRHELGAKIVEEISLGTFAQVQLVAKRICVEKVDWVVVAGGDGTLRALVEIFVENDYWPYVSVFPAGTVNLVAKELLQNADPERWIKRVMKGIATPIWLGKANDRIFLTVAGIGVDSLVVHGVTETEKKYLSKFAYVRQGSELVRKELFMRNWRYKFQVMIDNDDKWRDASSVIVAKSRYYAGRFSLVDGGSLYSPTLHVCMFTGSKRADFLRYAALIATDLLNLDKTVEIIQAKSVKIRSNVDNFVAELDGDSLVSSPLDISLIDRPLHFIS
jgi:diacylglycerol kinase (ATP)